jgi:hypothetical protein
VNHEIVGHDGGIAGPCDRYETARKSPGSRAGSPLPAARGRRRRSPRHELLQVRQNPGPASHQRVSTRSPSSVCVNRIGWTSRASLWAMVPEMLAPGSAHSAMRAVSLADWAKRAHIKRDPNERRNLETEDLPRS